MVAVFAELPLFADAGIPMIFVSLYGMVLLLIPIIVIEGLLCKRWLGLTTWKAIKSNAASNVASTIIGVPLAWALMFGVQFGTMSLEERFHAIENWHSPIANVVQIILNSAWISPVVGNSTWPVAAAVLVLLVPFFFVSYGIEYFVMCYMVGMPDGGPSNPSYARVRIAVRNANLITYGAIFIATSIWLLVQLPRH